MAAGKEKAAREAGKLARDYMKEHGSCAQSTVRALQDVFGIQDEAVLRASTAMTGGIGAMRDACGGLCGAALIFGQVYGRDRTSMEDKDRLDKTCAATGRLYKWYEGEFGSATCYDIKKAFGNGVYYDSSVEWQKALAEECGVPEKCRDLVGKTVDYMVHALWDDLKKE